MHGSMNCAESKVQNGFLHLDVTSVNVQKERKVVTIHCSIVLGKGATLIQNYCYSCFHYSVFLDCI